MNKYFVLIGSLLIFVTLLGCTGSDLVIPYSTSQFVYRTTDLNYAEFQAGWYDNNLLIFDGNKLNVVPFSDVNNSLIISTIDTNAQTACNAGEYLSGDGTCSSGAGLGFDTNFETAGLTLSGSNTGDQSLQTATDNGAITTNTITTGGLTSNYGETIYGNINVEPSLGELLVEDDFATFDSVKWSQFLDYPATITNNGTLAINAGNDRWAGGHQYTDDAYDLTEGIDLSFRWKPATNHYVSSAQPSVKFVKPTATREAYYGHRNQNFLGVLMCQGSCTTSRTALRVVDFGAGNSWSGTVRGTLSQAITLGVWHDIRITVNPDTREVEIFYDGSSIGTSVYDATNWASLGGTYVLEMSHSDYYGGRTEEYDDVELLTYAGLTPTIISDNSDILIEANGDMNFTADYFAFSSAVGVDGNVYADNFVDWTPAWAGTSQEALISLTNNGNKDGLIDHSLLDKFQQAVIPIYERGVTGQECIIVPEATELNCLGNEKGIEDCPIIIIPEYEYCYNVYGNVIIDYREGRNLGSTITMLVESIKALKTENDLIKMELCNIGRNTYSWCNPIGEMN